MNKKISVITPSLNRGDMIEASMRSVQAQDYENFEHIIVDGGSTDRTAEVVGRYQKVKFFCGPDQGMYDALNKGLALASGEIIGFLNTDDLYAQNVFGEVVRYFEEDESLMAVAGIATVVVQHSDGRTETVDEYLPEKSRVLEVTTRKGPYFNAWFFRRNVFTKVGNFEAGYKIAGDLEFMLRLALSDLKYLPIKRLVYIYQQHEGSLTFVETGQKRIASAKEKLALAEPFLRDPSVPVQAKRLITNLHTRETAELALRSMGAVKIKELYSYSLQGTRYDFLWPLHFLKTIAILVPKFVRKQIQRLNLFRLSR